MNDQQLSSSPTGVLDLSNPLWQHAQEQPKLSCKVKTMAELVERIPIAVEERKMDNIAPGTPDDPVLQVLMQMDLPAAEWSKYAFFNPNAAYTRNLVATDHSTYTALLLCWNPHEASPIHDHPCDGCWVKVLQGTVEEHRYDSNIHCVSHECYEEQGISFITDTIGYHKVGNPTECPAVTLHIYAPPITKCRIWVQEDCSTCKFSTSSHFSENGRLV
eukprot:Nitzschia sp. Nitz4//scaffold22_size323478//98447//99187//NITZ4_000518-RA/size323478-augustus-gene-0.230-mRNA-1//-1//CDS//3329542968//9144//frame0